MITQWAQMLVNEAKATCFSSNRLPKLIAVMVERFQSVFNL